MTARWQGLDIGYDIPACPGMKEAEIQTPGLILDLDVFEANVAHMRDRAAAMGVRLRVHGKMHRSADIARYQIASGGAVGICCQKVSEAEAFVRAGITDVLISNEVRDPAKLDRLARLPLLGARILVCVDDPAGIDDLAAAVQRHGTRVEVLVEMEAGADRCGVAAGQPVVDLARRVASAPGLKFAGIQAYCGPAQHIYDFAERKARVAAVTEQVRQTLALLEAAGFACEIVGGAGTGTYGFEGQSGLYTELQSGSYAFMDADYARLKDASGRPVTEFGHALFVLTTIMSQPRPGRAVCDAGLKALAVDSGLPQIAGRDDLVYLSASDEHGVIGDASGSLRVHDRLRLVPGHCDPTCNLHDWYVGVRGGIVEQLWPITARGKGF